MVKYCKYDSSGGRYICSYKDGECARLKREQPYGIDCKYYQKDIEYCDFCDKPAIYRFSVYTSWSSLTFDDEQTSACSITCGLKMNLPIEFSDSCPHNTLLIYKIKNSKFYYSLDGEEANMFLNILKEYKKEIEGNKN